MDRMGCVKAVAASHRQHVTKGMAGAHGARVGWDRRGRAWCDDKPGERMNA